MITSRELDAIIDPTDSNFGGDLAHATLKLIHVTQKVLDSDSNLSIELRDEILRAQLKCANRLGLMNDCTPLELCQRLRASV